MTALKMVETRSSLQREGVYRWFSVLSSAQRAEFLCGLLDLCVPIELRFLGSCLEDLARKDYHSLRDAEIKANNPADLANLTNITDEVVRSKLLISLALLSSDNREAAGVLFRTLTHIDTIINNYGLQLNDGQTGEQFLLLFTMASNHPAFSFHQKQVLRHELTQIQEILQLTGGEQQHATPLTQGCTVPTCITAPSINSCHSGCACASTASHREVAMAPTDESVPPDTLEVTPAAPHTQLELQGKGHEGKPNKVWVERVEVREVLQKPDKSTELLLQVVWSDSSQSCVSRTAQELKELLAQVSLLFPDECFEKPSPISPSHEPPLELDPRWLSSLPPHVLKHDTLRHFFTSVPLPQLPNSTSLGCLLPFRGVSRAVCGVASVQPVVNVPHGPPLLQSALLPPPHPPVPPQAVGMMTLPSAGAAILTECEGAVPPSPRAPHSGLGLGLQPQVQSKTATNVPAHSHSHTQPLLPHSYSQTQTQAQLQMQIQLQSQQQQQQQASPEQNCLLDWLRKLRLHKYYPVFKQLTMEEFLALTEEDLNKYDLTQGAKKKLKTQLELQKEKRYVVSQFPVSCGGVARVTPSSHVKLRVEVDTGSMSVPRDSSSSSGYSSAPNSPMTPQSRDAASFDRSKDLHRRGEATLDLSDKDRTVLMSPVMSGSRPTAQVLPVQNDPGSSLNLPPPLALGRPLASPRKPRPPPLCTDERRPAGMVGASRLESLFPSLSLEVGHPPVSSMLRSPSGLMVETSSALTATSNTLHHVSHPPLHLQLSPSLPMRSGAGSGHPYPFVLSSSSSSSSSSGSSSSSLASSYSSKSSFPAAAPGGVPMATASSIPMVAVPGNTYCVNNVSALAPSTSPTSSEAACYGVSSSSYSATPPASSSSSSSSSCVCVCSSCGCSGSCGSYATLPNSYAGYFPHPFSGTSVFTLGPLLHLSPLLTGGATAPAPFSYPVVAPPLYNSSLSHEAQQQQGLVLPPMQGFLGGGGNVYQSHGMLGNGGNLKKGGGNVSCYNCGVSGHRAQDCKQPPMDSAQQGTFRLRYAPHTDSQDSGD
ncbi:hypothetical protein AALO_G00156570 [Alosa alosa]|uniref:CCHC-type domain-containing protein n=1 Tax=Alosa alosa TaxID=278164 RepID=A0AAV6GFC9_9TELE|nr:hypothetical protein AALO_G00156570 [Alosa alosa]